MYNIEIIKNVYVITIWFLLKFAKVFGENKLFLWFSIFTHYFLCTSVLFLVFKIN